MIQCNTPHNGITERGNHTFFDMVRPMMAHPNFAISFGGGCTAYGNLYL